MAWHTCDLSPDWLASLDVLWSQRQPQTRQTHWQMCTDAPGSFAVPTQTLQHVSESEMSCTLHGNGMQMWGTQLQQLVSQLPHATQDDL